MYPGPMLVQELHLHSLSVFWCPKNLWIPYRVSRICYSLSDILVRTYIGSYIFTSHCVNLYVIYRFERFQKKKKTKHVIITLRRS